MFIRTATTWRVFFLLAFLISSTATHAADQSRDSKEVAELFEAYKASIIAQDGETAVEFVTPKTIETYQRIVDMAIDLPAEETRQLPLIEKLVVLMVRHRLEPNHIRDLNGRKLFALGVDRGWTSANSVKNLKFEEVEFDRGYGWIWIRTDPDTIQPGFFRAEKIDETWKLDLLWTLRRSEPALKKAVERSNMTEDEFVLFVSGMGSVKAVNEQRIWEPIGRED